MEMTPETVFLSQVGVAVISGICGWIARGRYERAGRQAGQHVAPSADPRFADWWRDQGQRLAVENEADYRDKLKRHADLAREAIERGLGLK